MRLGEAEALRVRDLRIGDGKPRAMIGEGKTDDSVRTVFLPSWVVEAIEEHVAKKGRSRGERIFRIPRRTTQKEHDRARKQIGRPEYTIHDHRHTAAVHLARAGLPLHLLQQQLGHSTIDITMRYATHHPDHGDVEEYFERAGRDLGVRAGTAGEPGNSSGNTPAPAGKEVDAAGAA